MRGRPADAGADVALVAAPDLVLAAIELAGARAPEPAATDCCNLDPPPRGRLQGRVIDADSLPLQDVATEGRDSEQTPPAQVKDEKDLDAYSNLFANVEYWKRIGEEYQQPLIVTGTVLFTPHQRNSIVQREEEVLDSFGRRRVIPVRTYMERKGFVLSPKFIFIDGRTGTVMHSTTAREEILYNANQATPALSSYFELMDRVIPSFLSTLSSQKIKGTRVLLQ